MLIRNTKFCWTAKEYKKGWRLGFTTNKTEWLNIWFANPKTIKKVLAKGCIVFIYKGKDVD